MTLSGANYVAGTSPPRPDPNDWLPAIRLAPLFVVKDPPATPVSTYYGETYAMSGGSGIDPKSIVLVDQINGEDVEPDTLDTLPLGADDKFNYQGSFLSLVQQDFPSITDLSELTAAEWDLFDGSFGLDTADKIAWVIDDLTDADYTVVARARTVSEPATITLLGVALIGFGFLRGRKLVELNQ